MGRRPAWIDAWERGLEQGRADLAAGRSRPEEDDLPETGDAGAWFAGHQEARDPGGGVATAHPGLAVAAATAVLQTVLVGRSDLLALPLVWNLERGNRALAAWSARRRGLVRHADVKPDSRRRSRAGAPRAESGRPKSS